MPGLNSIVDLVHPTVSGINVITSDTIWVLFDREIDESTVSNGNFFITGPDYDTWTATDTTLFQDSPSTTGSGSEDILESPGYEGLLQGTVTFTRVDNDDASTTVTGVYDTTGSGFVFRTKAIFTPENRLQASTTYTVHLSGDEDDSDDLVTGISERTVFDPISSGNNTSVGTVEFEGGYVASYNDIYHLTITTAGDVGDSRFTFFRESDPTSVFGPFRTKRSGVLLSDGVTAVFDDGNYALNDKWSVVTKAPSIFTGNIFWPFKTGSGSISTLPTTTSTTVLGDIPTSETVVSQSSSTAFSVSSTSPTDGATNQSISALTDYTITATFNAAIDAATVVSGVDLTVRADYATGEAEDGNGALGELNAYPSVAGSTLSIIVGSGQIRDNNIITVTLDSTIANQSGTALGTDYEWSFSTTYDPLYCTVRRLRLAIGAFISDVPDDTLNLAIHVASLAADELTWNSENNDDSYYQFAREMWTCCRAQEILLTNTLGGSGSLKSKKLGDLQVEYNTSSDTNFPLQRALDCQAKWEGVLLAGGQQVQKAVGVTKGLLDTDRPPVGRGWYHSADNVTHQVPVGNARVLFNNHSRYRKHYRESLRTSRGRRGWWER